MFLRKNGESEKIEIHLPQSPTQKKQLLPSLQPRKNNFSPVSNSEKTSPHNFNNCSATTLKFFKNILVRPPPPPTARNYDNCLG